MWRRALSSVSFPPGWFREGGLGQSSIRASRFEMSRWNKFDAIAEISLFYDNDRTFVYAGWLPIIP
jgi:hypothetical protein